MVKVRRRKYSKLKIYFQLLQIIENCLTVVVMFSSFYKRVAHLYDAIA